MKTYQVIAIIAFLLFSSIGMQAQNGQTQSKQVVIGSKEIIHSKILNEQREIWVYVPRSASDTTFSKQRYPVIYLLDADWYFSSVVGMLQPLSFFNQCPEMIVVGIPNPDRVKDLTPTHRDSWHFLNTVSDANFLKNSGGGENFISFIEKELIPHIDSIYSTAPYRMLIGHSMGGVAVINTLIHHTGFFKAYVAIDPSMSWDNQKLLKESKKALANNEYSGVSLFLGIANTMPAGMDTILGKKDTSIWTENIRTIFELRDYLSNNKQNQMNFSWKYYGDDNHVSVGTITEYDAIRFLFNYYHISVFSYDYRNIENIYEKLSKQFGYKVKPPEGMVNSLANTFLYLKYYDEAIYLFKLNVSNYPDSWHAYDALGDYYDVKGDKANAIDNYKKTLSNKEVPDTRKKLEKLQGK